MDRISLLILVVTKRRDRIDKRLIISLMGTRRRQCRLTMSLGRESWRPDVRNPDLHRTQALPAQALAMLRNASTDISFSHITMLHVTVARCYGSNYRQRVLVTAIGLGANLPEDAQVKDAT